MTNCTHRIHEGQEYTDRVNMQRVQEAQQTVDVLTGMDRHHNMKRMREWKREEAEKDKLNKAVPRKPKQLKKNIVY